MDGVMIWMRLVIYCVMSVAPDHKLFQQCKTDPPSASPTVHLSHLLRILGPSSMTLYKHVIGRRRILIFTLPPVEPACILCHVAADMCFENQVELSTPQVSLPDNPKRLKSKSKEGISVLGMVTLSDMDRLITESQTGRGWIACEFTN